MAIPEPEFKIDVHQMESFLEDIGYEWPHDYDSYPEFIHALRDKMFYELDTI